ncbi:MAG: manganese efflux pump MntP family protein [Dehalococcoidales bacterium]|nr:manganese efflux pump MntP family protein [Dehalococcoidales bacterium]
MDLLSIIFIALSLSADCFAVALSGSAAMGKLSRLQVVRTSLAFGLAQFLMPVIGWLAGRTIVQIISAYDHWVAFGLLAFVGGRMIWESLKGEDERKEGTDITRGFLLLTLAVATSIDALAVGLSFALLEIGITQASLIIGLVAFSVTALGFWLGRKAGDLLGNRAKLAGGVILIGIGLRILITDIM